MTFEEGKHYRHNRSMDIDIYVIEKVSVSEVGTELRVAFKTQKSRRLISFDEILIKPEQYPNWKEVPE